MALDRLLDISAHWFFYVLVLFLPVLVIPTCCRLSWPAVWPTFGAHDKIVRLIDCFHLLSAALDRRTVVGKTHSQHAMTK